MSRRTILILGAIAVSMAVYIFFFEAGTLSTGELQARRGRVLQSFVRPRVSEVEVRRGDVHVVLHRDREENLDDFEVGHWSLTTPMVSDADQESVDQLLSVLEWLEARRSLRGVTDEDRERFGLTQPAASLRFRAADRDVTVMLGIDDPRDEGVYVAVSDRPGEVFIVGRDFREALEHDVAHFRRKELFERFLAFEASSVELREGRFEFANGRWWMRTPEETWARASVLESLMGAMRDLRATRFLAERLDAADSYGLDHPTHEILVRRERTDREQGTPLRLRIGGGCPGHEGEVTAIAGEDGPVVCVERRALEVFEGGLERFRENRLITFRDEEIQRVSFASGDRSFELRREDMSWRVARGDDAKSADRDSVAEWMRLLRAEQAVSYEPLANASARGLESPRATLTVESTDGTRTETVAIGAKDADGLWVRRNEEPRLVRFALGAEELLLPSETRFRDRQLVRDAEANARRFQVERGGVTEEIVRTGSEWRVVTPLDAPADRVIVRDVARAMASLRAVRFVNATATGEHGLDRPRIVLTAHFEGPLPSGDTVEGDELHDHDHGHGEEGEPAPPRNIVLRLGHPTEGGAFAQLGTDPTVFVIPSELVDDLVDPLVSRDSLAIEASDIEMLTIQRGAERLELRRVDSGWSAGNGVADQARTTLILDRLASLRALGANVYGASGNFGFQSPTLVIHAERRGGGPTYELRIGAASDTAEENRWYYARSESLDATFRLGAPVVQALLDYRP